MPTVSFGTAQLYDLSGDTSPADILDEAWRVGFRRFDTAPMYGGGRSEPDLGEFLRHRLGVEVVTTKAGLPAEPQRRIVNRAKSVVKRLLPSGAVERLREARDVSSGDDDRELVSGRFGADEIEASVDESLRRLGGRIDRLLMHEIRPLDVTDDLLDVLAKRRADGDVGEVGVATTNRDTADVITAGGDTFTAVNLAVGIFHPPVTLPAHVTTRIGHGLLGPGGAHLRWVEKLLAADERLAGRWQDATRGSEFAGPGGVARALLSRGPALPVTELLVATTRVTNVESARSLATRREPLPHEVSAMLAEFVADHAPPPQLR